MYWFLIISFVDFLCVGCMIKQNVLAPLLFAWDVVRMPEKKLCWLRIYLMVNFNGLPKSKLCWLQISFWFLWVCMIARVALVCFFHLVLITQLYCINWSCVIYIGRMSLVNFICCLEIITFGLLIAQTHLRFKLHTSFFDIYLNWLILLGWTSVPWFTLCTICLFLFHF